MQTNTVSGSGAAGSGESGGWHSHSVVSGETSASGTGAITGTSGVGDSRPEFATILFCQKD